MNVSATTVSRAINNNKGVSAETRDKVLALCQQRGYSPNSAAYETIATEGATPSNANLTGTTFVSFSDPVIEWLYSAVMKM